MQTTDKSTTTEAKPEPGKTEPTKIEAKPDDKKADDKKPAIGAPEKYEFKAPEGRELDTKLIEAVTPILKEMNLSQDQANKLMDFWNANANKSTEALVNTYETVRKDWRKEVFSGDLGNGTDGVKPEVSQNIGAFFGAMDTKAATALKNALDLTGAGDHPALVSAMNAVGKLLREGSSVRGANPSPLGQKQPGTQQKSLASAMFPNLPSAS